MTRNARLSVLSNITTKGRWWVCVCQMPVKGGFHHCLQDYSVFIAAASAFSSPSIDAGHITNAHGRWSDWRHVPVYHQTKFSPLIHQDPCFPCQSHAANMMRFYKRNILLPCSRCSTDELILSSSSRFHQAGISSCNGMNIPACSALSCQVIHRV